MPCLGATSRCLDDGYGVALDSTELGVGRRRRGATVFLGRGVAPCAWPRVCPGGDMFDLLVMGFPGAVECCNCVAA